jgi:hypothetical protein
MPYYRAITRGYTHDAASGLVLAKPQSTGSKFPMGSSKTRAITYPPPPPSDVPALMRELVEGLRAEAAVRPVLSRVWHSFSSSTFTRSSMATDGRPGCSRRCVSTGRDTISSVYDHGVSLSLAS